MINRRKLFLSAVSDEFASHRTLLAGDLHRPNLDVAVQEDFGVLGRTTLEKVDHYIRYCDAVIHLIGKATGAVPEEPAVAALLATYPDLGTRVPPLAEYLHRPQPGLSYTQWEAYLALYHRRDLYVYRPHDFESDAPDAPRGDRFVFRLVEADSQKAHYQRISAMGHDRGQFTNEERLSSAVLRDLIEILPRLECSIRQGNRVKHLSGSVTPKACRRVITRSPLCSICSLGSSIVTCCSRRQNVARGEPSSAGPSCRSAQGLRWRHNPALACWNRFDPVGPFPSARRRRSRLKSVTTGSSKSPSTASPWVGPPFT
jgi:hypothetical protein